MKKSVIIVAGGSGKRMKSDIPKQFMILGNIPVIMHSINAFCNYDKNIHLIIVLHEKFMDIWKKLCLEYNFTKKHILVKGGNERFDSVKAGLNNVDDNSLVAIHDAVRPFVTKKVISQCFDIAEKKGNAIPGIPLKDSIRKVEERINFSVARSDYISIQTPQVFHSNLIKNAYNQVFQQIFTDDASVLESTGEKINIVDGNEDNIKITTAFDFKIAELINKSFI